ncbi:MAG: YmdB family metallophosphoesterase [Candidatus Flexifilum sp.]|jgi:metallophosphoesterase (TIGR00282 family)
MTSILFIGDLVSERAVEFLETHLPALRQRYTPDFVIANAENLALGHAPGSPGLCGMTPDLTARLFALGIDALTGGNHSWDGPHGRTIHDAEARIIRPLNYGSYAPGRGALIIERGGVRLGVINLMSRTAMQYADLALEVFERQMAAWKDAVDLVLVDYHGEMVSEKLGFAFLVDGVPDWPVAAVLGTHTHIPTLDTRVLPGGTAYVTDVGMTGPGGGVQGYAPAFFVEALSTRLPPLTPFTFATGPIELGAVLVQTDGARAVSIERVTV